MILKSIIALIGMAAIGWVAWRLVSMQKEPAGMDENDEKLRAKRASRVKTRKAK
jgi:hypothetical protein